MRAFGSQFQGGGHGIEVREESGEQFLYVCGYQQVKSFAKLDLKGEVVWQQHAPMAAGGYAAGEDTNPQEIWGRDRFMPTNFAFLPDGGFLLTDGYGSYRIHRYDKDGNWMSCFGGLGDGHGKFGRVSILDSSNRVVARLGDDSERIRADSKFQIRSDPQVWRPGRFVHPHDACFDREGNPRSTSLGLRRLSPSHPDVPGLRIPIGSS